MVEIIRPNSELLSDIEYNMRLIIRKMVSFDNLHTTYEGECEIEVEDLDSDNHFFKDMAEAIFNAGRDSNIEGSSITPFIDPVVDYRS